MIKKEESIANSGSPPSVQSVKGVIEGLTASADAVLAAGCRASTG